MKAILAILCLVSASALGQVRHVSFGSSPSVLILSTVEGIEDPSMTPLRDLLVKAGYRVMALDFPCHGLETGGLECWRDRVKKGDDFSAYIGQVLKMLDRENAVAVIGVSRAGYLALRIAEMDTGKRAYVLICPVVDLRDLKEFEGVKYAPEINPKFLRGKPIFLTIGRNDDRVNTARSVWLAGKVPTVKLLLNEVQGHGHPLEVDSVLVDWLKLEAISAP